MMTMILIITLVIYVITMGIYNENGNIHTENSNNGVSDIHDNDNNDVHEKD